MDELTNHIIRESNKYNKTVGNEISEEERTIIRENLKAKMAS